MVADRLGRDAFGVELNPEYINIARRRIEGDQQTRMRKHYASTPSFLG